MLQTAENSVDDKLTVYDTLVIRYISVTDGEKINITAPAYSTLAECREVKLHIN